MGDTKSLMGLEKQSGLNVWKILLVTNTPHIKTIDQE